MISLNRGYSKYRPWSRIQTPEGFPVSANKAEKWGPQTLEVCKFINVDPGTKGLSTPALHNHLIHDVTIQKPKVIHNYKTVHVLNKVIVNLRIDKIKF